ncbi:MAG TPA: guanylate kinase [Armatimonadota bacterium]|jgi:guanylate kinase|nr:guanylate kinase [Armatimonadota bacterium]HPP74911.1 guanylate kinase [Armatimonadota bacterium]
MQIWDNYRRKTGLVIVLSGPSGVGKDSVLEEFTRQCPQVTRCVTVTTRPPRNNEQQGVDYHFVSVDKFRQMVDEGQFLEFAEVHGNLYGTPKPWVLEQMAAGRDSILKIDVQGGISVKNQIPEAVMIFLVPPSLEELERRLRSRLTETDNDIEKRLLNARSELEHIPYYEYIIDNDIIENAVEKLRAIIIAEHSRIVSHC